MGSCHASGNKEVTDQLTSTRSLFTDNADETQREVPYFMLSALIAEDELLVRMGISSSVPWSELDIAIVGEARNGVEAWEMFQKYRPDIIILDILMPRMNGVELLGRIRQVDQRCAVIVVTSVDKGDTLDKVEKLGISKILNKMVMTRDDINEAVQTVCRTLRPERYSPSVKAEEEKDWKAFLFGDSPENRAFAAQGMTGIRLFPGDRLTPAMQRSLFELILQRLGEQAASIHVPQEGCELLIWKDVFPESVFLDIALYIQANFHVDLGIVTLFAPLQDAQLPRMARRFVTLLHEPQLFDRPVLSLNVDGEYVNERLEALRSEIAIVLPVCPERDELFALKVRLDRYPGEMEKGFTKLLGNNAPLLEALKLPTAQTGLWSMTRAICDQAEARLRQISPRIRPEIHRTMAFIQAHLTENIQREQLGRLVNYDSVYFSKLFKAELGLTYTDYMILARMLRAQELLTETDIPISDIVTQCGYTDFSYFSARFRRFCGMTPHEWRENNGEAMA